MPIILSLCDYSGEWSKPYKEAGYKVIQIDLKSGHDVRLLEYMDESIHGILMAPPCTAFSSSGAQYWDRKDEVGATTAALALVDACLRQVAIFNPAWWVLENPVGRLKKWLGPPMMYFQPYEYGDPYTKRTCLWGKFNTDLFKNPVEPQGIIGRRNNHQRAGGKSEKTKELRSVTPAGFAAAFFAANP